MALISGFNAGACVFMTATDMTIHKRYKTPTIPYVLSDCIGQDNDDGKGGPHNISKHIQEMEQYKVKTTSSQSVIEILSP